MAKDVLKNCNETIGNVLDVTLKTPLTINIFQCRLLERKLLETQEVLSEIQVSLCDTEMRSSGWIPTTKELYHLVKRAQKLITDCCCPNQWLEVAIKQGNIKEACGEIMYDLQWYMSLLLSCLLETSQTFGWKECDGKLSITDQFALSNAAKQDAKHLKSLFKDLKGDHICSEECNKQTLTKKTCLATQLVELMEAVEGSSNHNHSSTAAPLFLRVNPQDIPEGKMIGKGGQAYVRETLWLNESYAKKIFILGGIKDFEKETKSLARLTHPHILRLMCCSETLEKCELVMERMHIDLLKLLEEHRKKESNTNIFSLDQAVDLILQVAQGMDYIHSIGMVHRDLKSPNILINIENCVGSSVGVQVGAGDKCYLAKVADFGLATIKNASTAYSHQTMNVGTRKWMAPEMWNLEEDEELPSRFHPKKIDVYSFAIVCFELVSGEEPFVECTMKDLRTMVTSGQRPSLPKHIPLRLAHLIQRCWNGNPLLRPEFPEICMELRYIKGLLLQRDQGLVVQDDETILQRERQLDTHVRIQAGEVQVQGPWGGDGGGYFFDGMASTIKRIKVKHSKTFDKCIRLFEVEYIIGGRSFVAYHGDSKHNGVETIVTEIFMKKGEFFKQIEGYFGRTGAVGNTIGKAVVSLTLHSNLASYGPFGAGGETSFKSEIGQILGFFGKSGTALDQIGVITLNPSRSKSAEPTRRSRQHSRPCPRIWELYDRVVSMNRALKFFSIEPHGTYRD